MKEIIHPDFVKNKLEIRINLASFSLFQNGQKLKLKLDRMTAPLTDDSGRQRSLTLKDSIYSAPTLVLDGTETIRPFAPIHPMAYSFMAMFVTLGALFLGFLGFIIAAVGGTVLIRNIFLRDKNLTAKAGYSLLAIIAFFSGPVLLVWALLRIL